MASSGAQHPLPPPVAPTPPDFYLCNPFYGAGLNQQDCIEAASRLPVGTTPMVLGEYPIPHQLPIVESSGPGGCRVTVEWAFPDSYTDAVGEIRVAPEAFRQSASWIIHSCVAPILWGGFGTIGLENMINWIANDTTPTAQIGDGVWPVPSTFFTVTIDRDEKRDFYPEYNDPAVGSQLRDRVREKGNVERADALDRSTDYMSRRNGASASWWWSFKTESDSGSERDQSEMVYACDASLGAPKAVDCSQLAYSGLGPPSDTVTVGPGAPKYLSLKTCHAAITAVHSITLTWAQISAGLNTLLDNCVTHPWLASRGGRAFYDTSTTSKKRKRAPDVSGLDALPPGVNLTVSA